MGQSRWFRRAPSNLQPARDFVRQAVAGTGVDEYVAALLATELAANSIFHAGSGFRITVSTRPAAVRIAVTDTSRSLPVLTKSPADAEDGRGIWLVQHYADAWGIELGLVSKRVWFELRRAGAPAERGSTRRATSRRLRNRRRGRNRCDPTPRAGTSVPRRRRRKRGSSNHG